MRTKEGLKQKYEPGCYGDGSFGPDHTRRKVFEIALGEGWKPDIDVAGQIDWYVVSNGLESIVGDFDIEVLTEEEDNAIDYLNDHCSSEGFYWGYCEGDFGCWEIDEE